MSENVHLLKRCLLAHLRVESPQGLQGSVWGEVDVETLISMWTVVEPSWWSMGIHFTFEPFYEFLIFYNRKF